MTLEDTPKEAKLHGLQCPLDASSCDSFSRFHATRPKRGGWLLFFAPTTREI